MRLLADLLAVAATVLLWMAYRRRRNPMDLVAAVACAVTLALNVSRGLPIRADVGWREVAVAAMVVAAYFNLVGFPRVLVRTFRAGYRSAEWDFDMRLHDEKSRMDRLLLEYRSSEDWGAYRRWQAKVLSKGQRILRTLRSLNAPSPEWSEVRDGYVDLCGQILGRIARDELPDDESTLRDGTALRDRAEVLRIAYRTAARRWMLGSDRR